ncbi:MAG: hypothetical protein Q9209_005735 [Squamulea sp. 1 TL-2023]
MPLPTTHHYTPPTPTRPQQNPQQPPNQNTNTNNPPPQTSSHLTTLRHDELLIHNRKANIRRFGAGWLRPPGIPKTLQGMADERAEREEQELVAQREQAMMDAQVAAEEEAMEQNGGALRAMEGGEEGDVVDEDDMRDLDDEVPDAGTVGEVEGWESSDDDEDGNDVDEGNQEIEGLGEGEEISIAVDADVMGGHSFTGAGEEGEGDYGAPGMLEGEGRDLDEDVPEAGSYQHTDTEVEDESSAGEGGSFAVGGRGGVLGRSVWGGSPVGVMAGGGYDGPAGGENRRSRRTGESSSRGRSSRD